LAFPAAPHLPWRLTLRGTEAEQINFEQLLLRAQKTLGARRWEMLVPRISKLGEWSNLLRENPLLGDFKQCPARLFKLSIRVRLYIRDSQCDG
jgi:hypothetical protein